MVFSLGNVKLVLLGQATADLGTANAVVPVGDKFPVVVNSVENDMAVRMLTVMVTDNDVLGIQEVHPLQIILRNLHHKVITHFVNILNGKVKGNMANVRSRLTLKTERVDD